jgi:hypothetical protein
VKTVVEASHLFREEQPGNGQRPDLVFINPPGSNTPIAGDACVTCPVPIASTTPLPLSAARKPGRSAEVSRKIKEHKYNGPCAANGLEFVPLIFESTGRIDKPCDDFLKKVLKQKTGRDNHSIQRAYTNYWFTRLSCCLQKAIASSIIIRSRLINGNMHIHPNYQFDDAFILDAEFHH